MTLKVNLKVKPEKPEKVEILKFRDNNSQIKFHENTSKTRDFSNSLKGENSFSTKIENWKHMLDKHCRTAFPTIRIRKNKLRKSQSDVLIDKRNALLKGNVTDLISEEINNLIVRIANIISDEERLKCHVLKNFWDQSGSVNMSEMWKLKKKMWPNKQSSLPTAKINHKGRLVSSPKDIKSALRKEYMERLRSRPRHPKVNNVIKSKTILLKLKNALKRKSEPITMNKLNIVLKNIKTGKARDADGMVREICKLNIIGQDLKLSLLTMLNMIKDKGTIPDFMRKAHISTIPKKNKSRLHLKNERGIFLVNVIRGILMRVLFNRKSDMIDTHMSDSNIGGQKDKSGINHIWVLTGIIHEQLSSIKNPPIVVQQYDYSQMFDGMHLKEALSDIYDSGVKDDTINLIYDANRRVEVKVKTPHGLTEEVVLDEVVLQGEVWGPILASNQVDTFGREMLEEDYSFIYKYKGYIPVPLLGLIDDTISVNLAGHQAAEMNSYMNVKSGDKY